MIIEQSWIQYLVNYMRTDTKKNHIDNLKDAFYNGVTFLFNQLSEIYNADEQTFNELMEEILNELIEYNENLECDKK